MTAATQFLTSLRNQVEIAGKYAMNADYDELDGEHIDIVNTPAAIAGQVSHFQLRYLGGMGSGIFCSKNQLALLSPNSSFLRVYNL